jgi:hypothetical protein
LNVWCKRITVTIIVEIDQGIEGGGDKVRKFRKTLVLGDERSFACIQMNLLEYYGF